MAFLSVQTAQALIAGDEFGAWVGELGLRVEHVGMDCVRVRLPFSDRIARPGGAVIGQALMATADSVLVLAFSERMGRLPTMATLSMTTNFLRMVARRDVIVEGRATKIGRSVNFGEVTMFADGDSEPVGHAIATFAVLSDRGGTFRAVGAPRE
jgi:acyl-coenzyme A thioesterase PaaI-like protein